MFPKVTRDINEFWKHENRKPKATRDCVSGHCGDYTIWIRTSNPVTLLHELIHYPIRYLHRTTGDASLFLFCDFLTDCLDFVNGILRYKSWRKEVHEALEVVIVTWNDWLDWILCR